MATIREGELLRLEFRESTTSPTPTVGRGKGLLQANIGVVPSKVAGDFETFCRLNYGPLALIYRSHTGETGAPKLAQNSDIRTDLPMYNKLLKGEVVSSPRSLIDEPWEDMVTFYFGCSFSFEEALANKGIKSRNVKEGKNVSMYTTSIELHPVGLFGGNMVVSMQPMKISDLLEVVTISSRFPSCHGGPVHIGDPKRIGILNLDDVPYGDRSEVKEGEVPVFWACGVTALKTLTSAKLDRCFTHRPGHMYISDIPSSQWDGNVQVPPLDVIPVTGTFYSVLSSEVLKKLTRLESLILKDPGKRGVSDLFIKGDFTKAVLGLSHSKMIAITTGFPVFFDELQKEETDGLPGALAMLQALTANGSTVHLICDDRTAVLTKGCLKHYCAIGAVTPEQFALTRVLGYSEVKGIFKPSLYDCFVAIERSGIAADGRHYTMKGVDVSSHCDPIDDIYQASKDYDGCITIGIGDGGNELGMGKVYNKVVDHIEKGGLIGCKVAADLAILSGVCNWAGCAVAAGLYAVSQCTLHWRYRNHAIGQPTPLDLPLDAFVPTDEQTSSLLGFLNEQGVRDGRTGNLDKSVDSVALQDQLTVIKEIRELVRK